MKLKKAQGLPPEFLAEVSSEFSKDFLIFDPAELEVFGKDWTKVYKPNAAALAFPRTTQEVSTFLRLCTQYSVTVVPSGGRTGLAGGAVAAEGEIILSLNRMNQLGVVDPLSQTVRVQAGVFTESVHHHCAPYGLTWPIDFASKGSSQVGGNIATNAGGVKVIRYGLTRNWVLGLQVVTPQGEVLELNGALEKNNTGIDLRQLFIGSEGILGVITEATLKLARLPGPLNVFLFAVDSFQSVLKLFQEARKAPFQIMAFECFTQNCLELVLKAKEKVSPFQKAYPAYVLLELESPGQESQDFLDQWLGSLFENHLVLDGTLAQSPRESQELWSFRESISESLASTGFVHKNDIALPIANLEKFIEEMYLLFSKSHQGLEVFLFGHIGDGNLHVNTMQPAALGKESFIKLCHQTDLSLFELVRKYKGSISAEHGIGLLKKESLRFSRSEQEIFLMKEIKKILDPKGILNPGKIFN